MIMIDGFGYDVDILDVTLDVEFDYKFSERLDDGSLFSELSAVYYNQSITFGSGKSGTEFSGLFETLSQFKESHDVTIFTPSGSRTFEMYPSNISLKLLKQHKDGINSNTYWEGMKVNFNACKSSRSR